MVKSELFVTQWLPLHVTSNQSLSLPLLPVFQQNVPFVLSQSSSLLQIPRGLLVLITARCILNSDHAHKSYVQKEIKAGGDQSVFPLCILAHLSLYHFISHQSLELPERWISSWHHLWALAWWAFLLIFCQKTFLQQREPSRNNMLLDIKQKKMLSCQKWHK